MKREPRVISVTGQHAKVSDCIGAKPAVVTVLTVSDKPQMRPVRDWQKKNRQLCVDLPVGTRNFDSPVSYNRNTLGAPVRASVAVR